MGSLSYSDEAKLKQAEAAAQSASYAASRAADAAYANARAVQMADAAAELRHREQMDAQREQKLLEASYAVQQMGYIENPNALGLKYLNGDGIMKNGYVSYHLFLEAWNRGNGWGAYNLGVLFEDGYYVAYSLSKAISYYRQFADWYISQNDLSEEGINSLGISFYDGTNNNPKNKTMAFVLYEKAANLGSKFACANFAGMLASGDVYEKNKEQAIKYYEKAVNLGFTKAYYYLSNTWYDVALSNKWARVAAVECDEEFKEKALKNLVSSYESSQKEQRKGYLYIAICSLITLVLIIVWLSASIWGKLLLTIPLVIVLFHLVGFGIVENVKDQKEKNQKMSWCNDVTEWNGKRYRFIYSPGNSHVEVTEVNT